MNKPILKSILIISFFSLLLFSCGAKDSSLTQKEWRGVLLTQSNAEIPFNFRFEKEDDGSLIMLILNGNEEYRVDEIESREDSLFITMPLYNSTFKMKSEEGTLTGSLIRSAYTMPFKAIQGVEGRFDQTHIASGKGDGRWRINLDDRELIGEFVESEHNITGSLLTPTGDYRYFEGVVTQDGELLLSSFDGGFIRLFSAKSDGNSLSDVMLYTGFSKVEEGRGVRDSDAELINPYSITSFDGAGERFNFSFPSLSGDTISLASLVDKSGATIVQISGSWCPNCLDESRFLEELYQHYSGKVGVVSIAFERSREFDKASEQAAKLVRVAKISYPVLISGYTPKEVGKALPQLVNFKAFPTSIVLDRDGEVVRIHSGFNGPGTGVHYTNFKEEFYSFIDRLLDE